MGNLEMSSNHLPIDKNRHIKEYLSHYTAFPHSPHYAVLLTGAWGIGKTFLVKRFLDQISANGEQKHIYVSLFGLRSLDEIDDALFRAMYPVLGWKVTTLGGRVAKAVLKNFGLNADIDIRPHEVLNKFNAGLYVFDDLERCEVPINSVLGYINEFTEHDGCKVIIVANEERIRDKEEYRDRREKLIGKTFEVQSVFDEAFAHFRSQIDFHPTKTLFEAKAAEISAIYHQSELNNLRILQQTMWDFERFQRALTDKHRQNDRAMTALLGLIFALSFESKAGRIGTDDLTKRMDRIVGAMMARDKDAEPSGIVATQKRYPEVDLDDTALPDEVLIDILVKGIVYESAIRTSLDQSSYFVTVEDEPAWRTVWHAFDRTDEEFDQAVVEMERQFAEREFIAIGEILHVFGLRLWLADIGVLNMPRTEVVSECKRYIDDLYKQKQLKPSPRDSFDTIHFGGYYGLGVFESKTEEYRNLYNYLTDRRQAADENRYPELGAALLNEMTDPDLFFRRINRTNSEDNLYYDVPILAAIDPRVFVSSLLSLHPSQQRTIFLALKTRYEHNRLNRELMREHDWLEKVRTELIATADALSPITKHRLMQYTRSIDTVLGKEADAAPVA